MVLQDHFHPPLSLRRHWHSFHNAWATYIASDLNSKLPEDYFAEINVQFEIKPIIETVEINIFNTEVGAVLAGAIELVSPANKDRASHRKAFVSKCETLLRQGIGLVIVDVVTEGKANLHDELLNRITEETSNLGAPERLQLYATSYRVIERSGQPSIDIWQEKISVGDTLPTVPFWLRGNNCLPLELDNIYKRTCQEQRIYVKSA